jgi:hypothetical protein
MLVILGCAGAFFGIGLLAPDKPPETRQQVIARHQAHLLTEATLIVAKSNEGVLPPQETWRADIAPILDYGESQQRLSMRLDTRRDDGGVPEFIYVPPAPRNGETVSKLSDIVDPSTYILVYEDFTHVPSQVESIVAGLASGGTELLEREELKVRLAKQEVEQARALAENSGGGPD